MKTKSVISTLLALSMLTAPSLTQVVCADESTGYENPEVIYRPYARWWLAEGSHTDETLKKTIQSIYEAGFGGVEFVTLTSEAEILDDATYGWGSPEWIHDSKLILEECTKYGLSCSMTGGSYWATANLPAGVITPDDETASQELGYTAVEIRGTAGSNSSFEGTLPVCELPGDATTQKLVSVLAAPVLSWADEENGTKTVLDTDKIVSLSAEETDGKWNLNFETDDDGDYVILSFYQYGTSESYAASVAGQNYTINYYDTAGADAFIDYWESTVLTDEVQSLIDQMDECDLYMDSLELQTKGPNTTRNLWCSAMLDEFKSRRGYDLETYLPALISDTPDDLDSLGAELNYVFDMSESTEVDITKLRHDFYQTATELYKENCLSVIRDWLHSRNMKLRAEPSYGKPLELSQTVEAIDYLETESFEFGNEIEAYRNFAGPAHIYGTRLSSETGADIFTNYALENGYYRQLDYLQFASGIQKTVVHGYSCGYGPEEKVAWPGYEGMDDLISERFNERQPGYVDYPEVNAHLSRIHKVLEQGKAQTDLLMLRSDYIINNGLFVGNVIGNRTHNNAGYYWKDMTLQNNGYTYEYSSPLTLTSDGLSVENNKLIGKGGEYQAVVVFEDELPLTAANVLLDAAKTGLPILFVNNVVEDVNVNMVDFAADVTKTNSLAGSTTGMNDGKDDELSAVVEDIKACENVAEVDSEEEAMEALQTLGVYAAATQVTPNQEILTVTRKADDATYLYVYHYMYDNEAPYQGEIAVEGEWKVCELNTWTGELAVASAQAENGKTLVNIDLQPGDVAVYILTEGTTETAIEAEAQEIDLTEWNLTVDSVTPGDLLERIEANPDTGVETREVTYDTVHTEIPVGTLTELTYWKELEEVGENVSGSGTYATTLTLTEDAVDKNVILHAGSFNGGTASLLVNNQKVAINMDSAVADITDYVQPGENTISITVTSSLNNVVRTLPYIWWLSDNEEDDFYAESVGYGMTGRTYIEIR